MEPEVSFNIYGAGGWFFQYIREPEGWIFQYIPVARKLVFQYIR